MGLAFRILLLSLLFFWGNLGLAESVCPGLISESEVSPEFTDSEKLLLCGDLALEGGTYRAWARIPRGQAEIHLRAFLQTRGYLNPVIRRDNNEIHLKPGPRTRVGQIRSSGAPAGFDIRRRNVRSDQWLTPAYLTDTENWAREELQKQGFPCSRVQSSAQALSGDILLSIDAGETSDFGPVLVAVGKDFDPRNFKRFYPFEPEQKFSRTLLDVAEDRIVTEGLAEQTKMTVNCQNPDHHIEQSYVLGPPGLWTLSLSANTESLLQVQSSWRTTRLDSKASYFETSLTGSSDLQELSFQLKKYLGEPGEDQALRPLVALRHQDEAPFDLLTQQAQILYIRRQDSSKGFGTTWRAGPDWSDTDIRRGYLEGLRLQSLALVLEFEFRSFEHELYRRGVYEGWQVRLKSAAQDENFASDWTSQSLQMEMELLQNFSGDSPPAVMGLWKFFAGSTSSPHPEKVPPTHRFYLGGFESLRGFSDLQMPGPSEGSLTRVSTTFEVRSAAWSETLWPLAFIDLGWLGRKSFALDPGQYLSPGVGIHWKSPVGPLRASLAQGLSFGGENQNRNRWQFFLSWGERF